MKTYIKQQEAIPKHTLCSRGVVGIRWQILTVVKANSSLCLGLFRKANQSKIDRGQAI